MPDNLLEDPCLTKEEAKAFLVDLHRLNLGPQEIARRLSLRPQAISSYMTGKAYPDRKTYYYIRSIMTDLRMAGVSK